VALRRLPYRSLEALFRRERPREEEPGTRALIERLSHVKRVGEFSRPEFLEMCRWKSPRAAPQYRRNRAARICQVSRAVLASRSEERRLDLLTGLRGVSVPVASAILTLVDPARYGVLDIRVWQLLFALGCVGGRPGGRGFLARDWLDYLAILRRQARRLGISVREVEYTLFHSHRKFQAGLLYGPSATRRAPRTLSS
jgi:hypothetical protein